MRASIKAREADLWSICLKDLLLLPSLLHLFLDAAQRVTLRKLGKDGGGR